MHPSLSATLASLDEYIDHLREIRGELAQGGKPKDLAPSPKVDGRRSPKRTVAKKRRKANGSGRKEEVAKFIKTHGPSKRSDILAGTEVPMGTLAYALNDKTMFKRLQDGRWDNVTA